MCSAKSGHNLWQIWHVFDPWASPFGANGQMTMTVHNYRPRQFYRTLNWENPSSGYRDMSSGSLAAARPPKPWRQYPSSPEGWGVKTYIVTPVYQGDVITVKKIHLKMSAPKKLEPSHKLPLTVGCCSPGVGGTPEYPSTLWTNQEGRTICRAGWYTGYPHLLVSTLGTHTHGAR